MSTPLTPDLNESENDSDVVQSPLPCHKGVFRRPSTRGKEKQSLETRRECELRKRLDEDHDEVVLYFVRLVLDTRVSSLAPSVSGSWGPT